MKAVTGPPPPRGLCDAVQEAVRRLFLCFLQLSFFAASTHCFRRQLEQYIEMTGNQLADAMGVSFTDLGKRLQKMPFKMTGEQGIQTTIRNLIEKNTKEASEIEKEIGSWGSSWLLKASADDKQGGMSQEAVEAYQRMEREAKEL